MTTIKFDVPGKKRKELVQTIAGWLGEDIKYCGAPTFAYEIDYFTVDREGNLLFDDRADSEAIERLLEHLYDEGFESDIAAVTEKLAAAPTIDSIEDIDSVTLSFPDTGFDEAAFERLKAAEPKALRCYDPGLRRCENAAAVLSYHDCRK